MSTRERILQILIAPHVSEKSTRVADESRQVVFRVCNDARKPEIKKAVEELFEVKVQKVTVCNLGRKRKSFGRIEGKRAAVRKAYVTLQPGYELDFLGSD